MANVIGTINSRNNEIFWFDPVTEKKVRISHKEYDNMRKTSHATFEKPMDAVTNNVAKKAKKEKNRQNENRKKRVKYNIEKQLKDKNVRARIKRNDERYHTNYFKEKNRKGVSRGAISLKENRKLTKKYNKKGINVYNATLARGVQRKFDFKQNNKKGGKKGGKKTKKSKK